MNEVEHLLTCLGEEGGEVGKDCSKSCRFGIHDHNFLNPQGPSNMERLVAELNDFSALVEMLVERGIIPDNWQDSRAKAQKKIKVLQCMEYARKAGALTGERLPVTHPPK